MSASANNELYQQAEAAFAERKYRRAFDLILKILDDDFTYEPAWILLHRAIGKDQPFADFKVTIAEKHFPNKVHFLLEKELESAAADRQAPQPAQTRNVPSPAVTQMPEISRPGPGPLNTTDVKFCPKCGRQNGPAANFCFDCGSPLNPSWQKPVPAPQPQRPIVSQVAPQPMIPTQPVPGEYPPLPPAGTQPPYPPMQSGRSVNWAIDKYKIPVLVTGGVLLILLFILPPWAWIILLLVCGAFFAWKLGLFPANVQNAIPARIGGEKVSSPQGKEIKVDIILKRVFSNRLTYIVMAGIGVVVILMGINALTQSGIMMSNAWMEEVSIPASQYWANRAEEQVLHGRGIMECIIGSAFMLVGLIGTFLPIFIKHNEVQAR